MGLLDNRVTIWMNMFPKGKKPNMKAHLETMRLLIDVNNSDISIYTNYLIAAFSVFIPLYFTLWSFDFSWIYFIVLLIVNFIVVSILLNRIKNFKECNKYLIEGHNTIQSQLGGSLLYRIDTTKSKIKELQEIAKKTGIEFYPYDPFKKRTNNEPKQDEMKTT